MQTDALSEGRQEPALIDTISEKTDLMQRQIFSPLLSFKRLVACTKKSKVHEKRTLDIFNHLLGYGFDCIIEYTNELSLAVWVTCLRDFHFDNLANHVFCCREDNLQIIIGVALV